MTIFTFTHAHIPEATALALANYEEERRHVPALPFIETTPDLTNFADNGLGVAAFEKDKMLGFLCCYPPFDNAFTGKARGTFSPIHAHGSALENREKIYQHLYQHAAQKWVKAGIASHAIGLYAHDKVAISAFFTYGFGLRCIDGIRSMELIDCKPCAGYAFTEIGREEMTTLTPLRKMLTIHLGESPCFMKDTPQEVDEWIARAASRNSRAFIATQNSIVVAFLEIMDDGENFATEVAGMQNICGAYCLPEHRGKGVYQNLLNFVIAKLKAEGSMYLGVDFESFNSTAYGFWMKYFTAYTHGVVRRIDENALEIE